MPELKREDIVSINQKGWTKVAPRYYGGTALPQYGPLAATENELNLIPDLDRKTVLELGCGSGHSLAYLWESKHACELWGLDLAETQINFTRELLEQRNIPAQLVIASMDENPGIPDNYFDLVISIYALGWTPNLSNTFALIHSCLKPGGMFIFSWEHPAYQCLRYDDTIGKYVIDQSYLLEEPVLDPSWKGVEMVINHRKISTYLNTMMQAGLVLDKIIESEPNIALAREQDYDPEKWYSIPRAQSIPTTLIVKARKPA
jgi:SAM-dependent methyltransferase